MNKNQELETLYDTVRTIYKKNISFLSLNYPSLLEKINYFESLNLENYFIEFINNHFELVNSKNNHIYNCDPFYDAQKRCENIALKPSFKFIKNEYLKNGVSYIDSINANTLINQFLSLPKESTQNFNKFIFFGTLLGVHINDLNKELNSKVYLIVEDTIEIFRLSMFLTDYESIANNSKLFFCVGENAISKEKTIKDFLKYKYEFNNIIGFEVINEDAISYIENFTKYFVDVDPYNYPFSEYIISLKRSFFYKKNSIYGILDLKNQKNILTKPILFLGAGSSLGKNIEWVYMNQDKFIIICPAACLKRLELLDIVPDVILSVDGQKKQILTQFEVNQKYYKNSLIILSTKTDLELIHLLDEKNTFFMQDNLEVFDDTGIFTGVTVGDIGLDLILRLGANEIYMLGFDACIDEKGKTHDGIYKNHTLKIEKTDILKNNGFNSSKNLIQVKGNFKEEVFTTMLFKQMIGSINFIVNKYKTNTKIYNLSDGAYFENTIPLKIESNIFKKYINLDKSDFFSYLKKNLMTFSKKKLTTNDEKSIKQEQKILKKLQMITLQNKDKEFEKLLTSYKNSLSLQILEKFFILIKPYRNYVNTKESFELEFIQFQNIISELKEIYEKQSIQFFKLN